MSDTEIQSQDDEVPSSEDVQFRRGVKTYVIRAGRMTDNERRSYQELNQVWCIPFEHRTLNFTDIFSYHSIY